MTRKLLLAACCSLLFACSATGQTLPPAANDTVAEPRLVAIGDVHGDYDQFVRLLQAAGLVNKRNKWIAGDTRFVQLGDIPDRGPDTRKIMDLMMKLEKGAAKAGGSVTALIGNHEAMNLTDDLRYVHPGEYAAFKDRKSQARNDNYYQRTVAYLKETLPEEELPVFDQAHREQWNAQFPLGYVEHRVAWAPAGKYGSWVLSHPAVAVVADTVFAHGGISAEYAVMPVSEMNTRIRTELANYKSDKLSEVFEDPEGPLWYRGWATAPETPENQAAFEAVLAALGVSRMVVAHTPMVPIVLPRFGGKLLIVDVGLSAAYGSGFSALELSGGKAYAILDGGRVELPEETGIDAVLAYFDAAENIIGPQAKINNYRQRLLAPPEVEEEVEEKAAGQAAQGEQ